MALLGVAFIYALNYYIAKWTFQELPPLGIVAMRTTTGVLVFGWLHWRYVGKEIQDRRDYFRLFWCGIFGATLNQVCFFWGLSQTVEVNASALMITTPVFVFLIAALTGAERFTGLRILGLILSFMGAYFLVADGRSVSLGADTLKGDILVAINAAAYGVYLVIVRPLVQRYHFLTILFWVYVFGSFVNVPQGLWSFYEYGDISQVSLTGGLGLAYILICTTILAFLFNGFALSKVHSSVVGIYVYLQPVLVALLALIWTPDYLTWTKLSYMIFVMVGVIFVTYRKKTL